MDCWERTFWGPEGIDLELEVFSGHGSYVAGEETAMLESMQGRPAMPRQKPPFYPTDFGLYGKPTLVNNVETLCNIPQILKKRRRLVWTGGHGEMSRDHAVFSQWSCEQTGRL